MSDKREYIRIKDEAVIRLKAMETAPQEKDIFPLPLPKHFKLLSQVIASQSEEVQILHAIETDSSATAKYLKQMNSKIEALAELIISSHPDASKFPEQKISVSETGVDFYLTTPLPTDSYVALNMVFMPNYLSFELYAKVISCTPLSSANDDLDPMYRFGLQFVHIGEQDRDRIARRIFHKQLEERRKQRLSQ